jgi:hypothetical protein
MNVLRIFQAGGLTVAAAAVCFQAASLFGGVPSCEKELAKLYPPALKGDLSACAVLNPAVKPTAAADLSKFARRLNGTWELKMRTIQGITADTRQLSAKLYFDVAPESGIRAAGNALMLEVPKTELIQRVSTPKTVNALGYWDVAVSQRGKMAVSLAMSENAGGRIDPPGSRTVKEAQFSELQNVFVSLDKQTPAAEAWDRIILTGESLIYVSCKRGVVEQYSKVSGQKPQIEGMPVKTYWQKLKSGSMVATTGASSSGSR